jgi:hypothetical protein
MLKFNFKGKDKINVLGQKLKIVYLKKENKENRDMGLLDAKEGKIYLSTKMNKNAIEETLLHEIIHALAQKLGIKLSERKVVALSSGLYSFFKSN